MKLHSSDISQDTPPLGVPMASPGEVTPPLPDEDSVTPPFEAFRFFFFSGSGESGTGASVEC